MATSSASYCTDDPERKGTSNKNEREPIAHTFWTALFSFTTAKHIPVLSVAVFAAFVAALTLPALAVVFGLVLQQYTDYGAGKITVDVFVRNVSRYCTYITAFGALSWFSNSIYFTAFLTFGELQARSAKDRIFNSLLKKDMAWYDTRETGPAAFLSATQMQIHDLQISVSQPFGEACQSFFMVFAAFGVALYSSWSLALIVISTVPLVYLVMAFISKLLSKCAHEHDHRLQQSVSCATNAINSIEMVKCFNGERTELQRFTKAISWAGAVYKRQGNLRSMQLGIMQFFTLSVFVQGFWYGSYLVISGKTSAGQVLTTFWAALIAVQGVTEFLPQLIILQKGQVAGSRLRAMVAQMCNTDSSTEAEGRQRPEQCVWNLTFEKVSFCYPSRPEQIALRDVTLSIPAGKTTFVIGRSGSGKSTLGQLLVRFYQPASGQIYLGGVPLQDLDVRWLREHITLVEQHSVMFNDSIRQNIALGKKAQATTEGEIEKAVTFAILQQMVQDLPDGMDTLLGIQGNTLSGGQRQRLAIARARLRDTPILILDESTSALDYITRSAIVTAIRAWRQGKTTLIITHDISQILPSDSVYVMDRAAVIEYGTRKVMEADYSSVFHTFLNLPEQDELGEAEEDMLDDTEELLSLYAASWGVSSLQSHPSSAAFFRQALRSPLLSPRRPSRTPSVVSLSRRPSTDSGLSVAPRNVLKAPIFPALGQGTLEESGPRPRLHPASRAARYSMQSMYMPRPISFTPSNLPIHMEPEDGPSFCKTVRARIGRHRRPRSNVKEPVAVVKTLGIFHVFKTLWPLVGWSSRLALISAGFCTLIHSAATPTFAYIFSRLLETFYTAENQREQAKIYALSILGIAVVDGLAEYGSNALFESSSQTWANALKAEGMKRVLLQSREFFDQEENSVSRLAECFSQLGEEARNLPGRFCGILSVLVFMVVIAIIWSMAICWELTLMALACLFVVGFITKVFNTVSSRWEKFSHEADVRVGEVLYETFANIRTVRCLVLEDFFRAKYEEATSNALKIGLKRSIYSGSIFGLNYASTSLVTAFLFWWGAYIVSRGRFTATDIIMTFNILMLSVAQVTHLGGYIPQINVARDAASRLMRLSRLPQDSHEISGTEQLFSAGDITLEGVNFAYPTRTEHPVLHNVTFDIPRGSCTAVVGSSGSGKSTIAILLLKLYQTSTKVPGSSPDISISGQDIKRLHTSTLRSRIAIVAQTPVLFPGTILENITYGLSPSSALTKSDKIHAAATAAGAAEFIDSLPQGYRTIIGEGGTGLSGGQAQRIAIARAVIREPDILILDEATSALDVESAGIIRDTIQCLVSDSRKRSASTRFSWREQGRQAKPMTVIIITHAREMMAIAEHIVMLDKGRVVEEGRFDELKRRRGPFSRLLRGEGVDAHERSFDWDT